MDTFNKIFEVIDDNGQKMPEFVYLELMNLLKVHHKEIKESATEQLLLKDEKIKELEIISLELMKTINRGHEIIKEKDLEIIYEKKKTNALIRHIGGGVQFNKSYMKYKLEQNKYNNN